jgi:hypothetical protein
MKCAVEMGSGAMIYTQTFIKTGSGIQMFLGGGIHRQHGDLIGLLSFFKNMEIKVELV